MRAHADISSAAAHTTAKGTRVLLAMSGGVDSSVAAALLLEQGYDVVGLFMRLGTPSEEAAGPVRAEESAEACRTGAKPERQRGCCSVGDAADARLVCAQLGIPLYVRNFASDFGRIIDYFVDEYAKGRTPNPCVRCNDWLKFGRLHDDARAMGCDAVASGHHARIVRRPAHDGGAPTPRLYRGADPGKDQSYVLFGAPKSQLPHMMLPVGHLTKAGVRAEAERLGLSVADKPDSQEICFVPDDDYAGLVERKRPDLARSGDIVDREGNRVGAHDGQHRFTIGQRRGVGVALGYPIYVVDKDPQTNTVTVGTGDDLRVARVSAGEANWHVDPGRFATGGPCLAQTRSSGRAVPASVRTLGVGDESQNTATTISGRHGRFEVVFDTPHGAAAPGQAVVLYDPAEPDAVLGGGWIEHAERA